MRFLVESKNVSISPTKKRLSSLVLHQAKPVEGACLVGAEIDEADDWDVFGEIGKEGVDYPGDGELGESLNVHWHTGNVG